MKQFFKWLFYHSAYGLTFLRVVLGGIFVFSGYLKIFQMNYAIYYLDQKGYPAPEIIGPLISYMELFGGIMLLVGIFVRQLGLIFALEFLIATLVIATSAGVALARFEFMILTSCIVLATQGAGRFAVDRPGRPWEPFSERRRRLERWKWHGEARMMLPHHDDGEVSAGKVVNINQSGVSVTGITEKIEVGSTVQFELQLSDLQLPGGPLKLEGKVRWITDESGNKTIGIKFDEMDPTLDQLFQREEEEVDL